MTKRELCAVRVIMLAAIPRTRAAQAARRYLDGDKAAVSRETAARLDRASAVLVRALGERK